MRFFAKILIGSKKEKKLGDNTPNGKIEELFGKVPNSSMFGLYSIFGKKCVVLEQLLSTLNVPIVVELFM